MKLVTIVPLAKNAGLEVLTYFSAQEIPLGSIIGAPLRKKIVKGIVIETADIELNKSEIKNSDFQLKKVVEVYGTLPISNAYQETINELGRLYATGTSNIWNTLVPKTILPHLTKAVDKKIEIKKNTKTNIRHDAERLVLQNSFAERISFYKTYIRESFAKKESVHIVVPTISDIEIFSNLLEKGIKEYVVTFSSKLSKKEFSKNIAQFQGVKKNSHALVIISTAPFLVLERDDVKTIIIECESSRAYKTLARPYLDMKDFVKTYATFGNKKLILADTLCSVETIEKVNNKELEPAERIE